MKTTGSLVLPGTIAKSLQDGDTLAAIDMGSNSFHMIVARVTLGQLRVVDRLRETVRLGEGLYGKGRLQVDVRDRALACLERFGQRIRRVPPHHVRALATNAVRRMAVPRDFLVPAEYALGHAIEVIAGREEARLIYQGVAHVQPPKPGERRMVIDIGGGSTECIIGRGLDTLERESLQVGCISSTQRFFPSGKLTREKWQSAFNEVAAEFQQFASTFRAIGWQETLGSSGTNKAIGGICAAMGLTKGAVTAEALPIVRDRLIEAGHIDALDLPGLSEERRPVIAGGLLALEAAFAVLGLERMAISKAAMREGVLYDMLGRGGEHDPREAAIHALTQRYGIDETQAARVHTTALRLFDQVAEQWQLGPDDRLMLGWAARLHEIGLTIAHSQHHVHGAYILAHSDIPGFSQQEQRFLAALVRTHRRKVSRSAFDVLPDRLLGAALRLGMLLRLAVLLHHSGEDEPMPLPTLAATGSMLRLQVDPDWLDAHPLLRADLEGEAEDIQGLGIALRLD
ncbi:Ppx/GppA phosphatase family protein [Luteimonas sp. MJ293]|uniref:Ppx/GppA phosphatase family protein n=1 Tax=Luteimonas sp. MJ146 TaxID=3129240 RepID=UPI0031BA6D46